MKKQILLLLFLFSAVLSSSQTNYFSVSVKKDRNTWEKLTYDLGNMAGGMGYAYTRPLYWKKKQFVSFGYIATGTAALYAIDDNVDYWADGWRNDVPRWITDYGNNIGSPNNNFMFTGAVYLTGLFTDNPKLRRTGVLLISSAAASGLLQQISKRIVGRARPRINVGKSSFDPFHIDRVFNYDSFPSGHTMLGFTNAYAIAKHFDSPWIKAGLYSIGSIPGIARIIDRFHWISDVAFSTAISIFIVEAIDRFLDIKYDQKYNDQKMQKKLAWDLQVNPGSFGITMNF